MEKTDYIISLLIVVFLMLCPALISIILSKELTPIKDHEYSMAHHECYDTVIPCPTKANMLYSISVYPILLMKKLLTIGVLICANSPIIQATIIIALSALVSM
jgi:hypothetical protein